MKFDGYKPYVISTIVDSKGYRMYEMGYKPYVISTIVDKITLCSMIHGYKPYVISTIVDIMEHWIDCEATSLM